ncbi:MAG: hypothetical protein ACK5FU_05985 [Bacteroidota bacterium]|jgi:hypothetical protein|nr:hypothetical protein [Sphingobacteriales bacterium]
MQKYRFLSIVIIFLLEFTTGTCQKKMSEYVSDEHAGFNASFEISKNNFPVNWLLYTPSTVPNSSFTLQLSPDATDGKQSLLFDVKACEETGGWRSPGIAKELPVKPGQKVKIKLQIKNAGCKYRIQLHPVNVKDKSKGIDIVQTESHDWKMVTHDITIPDQMNLLRFEFNVLSAGKCWIDDVRIDIK